MQCSSNCAHFSPATAVDSLDITQDSLDNFHPSMDANFAFNTPLKVEALDASGYVVTDGPDANLVSAIMYLVQNFHATST